MLTSLGSFKSKLVVVLFVLLVFLVFGETAYASDLQGDAPWDGEDSPLSRLLDSVTGPIAGMISVFALIGVAIGLVWGGEMTGIVKTLAYVVLAISFIVGATNAFFFIFNTSSAVL